MASPSRPSTVITYIVFTATGAACALPGVLLPDLIAQWRMSDLHAGTLLFLLWVGSSLGALAVRGRLSTCLGAGAILTAAGCFGLAAHGVAFSAPSSFLYGLGLGVMMTAISIERQRVQSTRRALELVRLNLTWALGAFAAPALAWRSLRSHHAGHVLQFCSLFFALAAVWALTAGRTDIVLATGSGLTRDGWRRLRNVPLALILITIAAPGIESASGAWLATYAQRTTHTVASTAAAPSCLWAGLLLSRLIGAAVRREDLLHRATGALLALGALAAALLVLRPAGLALLTGAFLLGFALGPLYPLLLARVMAVEEVGAIFFLAGVAASVLPWLTGAIASWTHSLRAGMTSIAAVAVLAFMLNWTSPRRSTP